MSERRRPPPAPGALRDRARAPRPRGRRRRARRPLHASRARRACSAPTRTGSARDLPADEEWRIEWVKFDCGLDLAHAAARPATRYQQAWERLTASWIRAGAAGRGRAPRSPRAGSSTGSTRGSGFDAAPGPRRPRCSASLAAQVAHVRANLAPGAQPPHARAVRAARRRARAARARPRRAARARRRRARPQPRDRLPARRRAPRGLDALPPDRAALVRRRARERAPLRGRAPAPASTSGSRAPARSRCTARGRTGRSPRSPTPTRGDYGRCSPGRRAARRRGAALRGSRGAPGDRPRSATRASPTAATTCSAAAGTPSARFLIFDCGPLGDGGHGHYDLLSVEAHGGGRAARRRPRPRQLLRGAAEPAALVPRHRRAQHRLRRRARPDALQPRPARSGRSRTARLLGRGAAPGLDVLAGEAISPAYEAVHRRRIAFVADRVLGDRGPRSRASARTASTCASTSPPRRTAPPASTARTVLAPGLALDDPRRASTVAPRAAAGSRRATARRLDGAGRQRDRRRAGRARRSSRCSRRARRGEPRAAADAAGDGRRDALRVDGPTARATRSHRRAARLRGDARRARAGGGGGDRP